MLDFKPIEKERINEYKSYYDYTNALGCEFNFVSGYLWSEAYQLRIAFHGGALIKAYFRDDVRVWGYCMPSGSGVTEAVEALFEDARERGQTLRLAYMSQRERDRLETLFPGRFIFTREPDNQDYIYYTDDLAALAGKKFHAKRNHISKFYRTYGDDAHFAPLCLDNLADAMRVVAQGCEENGITPQEHAEYAVLQRAFADFDYLNMRGGLLYIGDKPVAMTMGTEISSRCFDVMFEKALRAYEGAYAVINNEFAKTLTAYRYINREEDLGKEGLRKAKLSYHPAIIYDRYSAVPVS